MEGLYEMPKRNRLQLDFSLSSAEERQVFLTKYLDSLTFTPTSSELELMADYVLWGDKDSGETIELETFWKKKEKKVESLDELKENPTFLEARFTSPYTAPKTQKTRRVFSREEARSLASPYVLAHLEDLWREIDTLDLETRFYENFIGRQAKPPRSQLLERFTSAEAEEIRTRAQSLTEYAYLKKRKLLVEKRSEQYPWRDTYTTPLVQRHTPTIVQDPVPPPLLNADIPILPLGNLPIQLAPKIFPSSGEFPTPGTLTPDEEKLLSKTIWRKPSNAPNSFDFRDPAHLASFISLYSELLPDQNSDEGLQALFSTFTYYQKLARLSPLYLDILRAKVAHETNTKIVEKIASKYGKTYGENYISTLYRQKILPKIAAAASAHYQVTSELFFPENFKTCKDCARTLLRTPDYFMRKAKSSDGFSPRCKACEKALRERRKN